MIGHGGKGHYDHAGGLGDFPAEPNDDFDGPLEPTSDDFDGPETSIPVPGRDLDDPETSLPVPSRDLDDPRIPGGGGNRQPGLDNVAVGGIDGGGRDRPDSGEGGNPDGPQLTRSNDGASGDILHSIEAHNASQRDRHYERILDGLRAVIAKPDERNEAVDRPETASLANEARVVGYIAEYCARHGLPTLSFISRAHELLPINIEHLIGPGSGSSQFFEPSLARHTIPQGIEEIGSLVPEAEGTVKETHPSTFKEVYEWLLGRFLQSIRLRPGSKGATGPKGYQISVSTDRSGLTVLYCAKTLFQFNRAIHSGMHFGHPTTPVQDWIDPGIWIFGLKGEGFPERWDLTGLEVPAHRKIHLSIQ
jgi:hypothetical protein